MVPVFVINGASSVSISQYLPYVPCRAGVISNNCDPGAKASLRSLGDLNPRIIACADKAQKPQPYSVVGLQYCGIDTTTPGTYMITYHLTWPSVGTLVVKRCVLGAPVALGVVSHPPHRGIDRHIVSQKSMPDSPCPHRQLLVVERCVGEQLCPDGFCSVDLSCARNVSSTISSYIVVTGDANGLLPNSTSLSTNNPPTLSLRNGEVVNTTVGHVTPWTHTRALPCLLRVDPACVARGCCCRWWCRAGRPTWCVPPTRCPLRAGRVSRWASRWTRRMATSQPRCAPRPHACTPAFARVN